MAGPQGVYQAGAVVDLPDEQAREIVSAGYAVAIDVEVAESEPVETAESRDGSLAAAKAAAKAKAEAEAKAVKE